MALSKNWVRDFELMEADNPMALLGDVAWEAMDLKLSPRGSMRILYDPVRFEDFEAYSGPTFLQLPPLKHSKGFSVLSLKC